MKLLAIGDKARIDKYLPDLPIVSEVERIVVPRGTSDADILAVASDADFILADAVSPVSTQVIEGMPNLKIIQSEGVAFNLIDLDAARRRNVYVCNNRGMNAGAVAEQAILLMLACLRDVIGGDAAVREGRQIQTKERMMVEGIRELGDCKVGFIGFGAIAKATAQRLLPWGCDMVYYNRHPLPAEDEAAFGVHPASLDEIAETCDIVSVHVPVTVETRNMIDADFLARMKDDALLINTARGEIVDQQALADALINGTIGGAGLDTLAPEPVPADHILVTLPKEAACKVVFSPHIGGVTEGMFVRAHRNAWNNFALVADGKRPVNIVS